MRKFVFDPSAVRGVTVDQGVSLPDGMPFVLDDDFKPIEELNAWLRSLRERGSHSPRTWDGYADDVLAWTRFLISRREWLWDEPAVLQTAMADYRDRRLHGGTEGPFGVVGHSAWNRAVAALDNFYEWAVEQRCVAVKPFRYKQVRIHQSELSGHTTQVNLARAKAGSRVATMRHLSPDFADLFIEAGLGGALPSGEPDLSFRGRLATRNRAAGHLIRHSGLRRQEFSNLLVWEAPRPLGPFSDFVAFPVPASIAKGAKSRTTWATNQALEALNDYIELERNVAVTGSAWAPEAPLFVEDPNSSGGTVAGKRVRWSRLSIEQRRRLVAPGGGSALLFVRGNGAPPKEENWRYTFETAASRCRKFNGRFPVVTPHVLRHTFAMETLNQLTRGALTRAERLARVAGDDPLLMAVLRRNDPLLVLRDLLGHSSLHTTEIYLAAQDPASILSDAEIELLAAEEEDLCADLRMTS